MFRTIKNIWKEKAKLNKYVIDIYYRKTGENTEAMLQYHGDTQ